MAWDESLRWQIEADQREAARRKGCPMPEPDEVPIGPAVTVNEESRGRRRIVERNG